MTPAHRVAVSAVAALLAACVWLIVSAPDAPLPPLVATPSTTPPVIYQP